MDTNRASIQIAVSAVLCVTLLPGRVLAQRSTKATAFSETKHDVSPSLRNITPVPENGPQRVIPVMPIKPGLGASSLHDSILQTSEGGPVGTIDGVNFDGLGQGVYGFSVNLIPPDPNGAVGATQFMQWVNSSFAIFDKATEDLLYGPAPGTTLFSGFGGPCELFNRGDGVILYDKAADRWLLSQITLPRTVCIALSTSSDATGSYYRYAFDLPNLPPTTTLSDYPKFGVWPDGYYYSANIFEAGALSGVNLCAFDRSDMLTGGAATAQCFFNDIIGASYLPSDLDGTTPPPDGSPNFLLNISSSETLGLLRFHADFSNPDNATLTGPISIPVVPFSFGSGVPQLGTTQVLDTLGDRLMFRLAYRNFGDHESLVANHSVAAGVGLGVRWYEIQSPNDTPVVYQQGTYAPDDVSRWMGSIAMDQAGNIAVGYSASSSNIHPAIRYTGRLAGDPLGTLEEEKSIIEGTGSQMGLNANRWGDYSSITIDPTDDCTFWYTNEYLISDGLFNWNTRLASFRFPSCGGPNLSISPTELKFNGRLIGTTSAAKTVTVLNTSTNGAVLTVTSVSISGTNSSDFNIKRSTCATPLMQGASCSIRITFSPTHRGERAATLNISDNASNSPQAVSLSGKGHRARATIE